MQSSLVPEEDIYEEMSNEIPAALFDITFFKYFYLNTLVKYLMISNSPLEEEESGCLNDDGNSFWKCDLRTAGKNS